MADLGKAYVQIIPKAEGISGKIGGILNKEGDKAGKTAGDRAGKGFAGNIKKVIAGAAIGGTVIAGFKAALDEGGKLQQSYGGLETLYGDAADAAKAYATQAAQAGISANDYAEQAVSFGASLKQAFGGDTSAAVEAANTAIMDMTDNAAKMGTPIESVQQAYQGFAKGQYQLLDNLKLGYGGTKAEMERLLSDAQAISGVEYNMDNLGDVYSAIHVIQGELGLTGVAAQEASTTFSGSFGAMQASAKNLIANLAMGQDIAPAMQQLASSASTFLFGNLFPMIGNVIKQLPAAIGTFIRTGLPQFIAAGSGLVTSLVQGVQSGLPSFLSSAGEMIADFGASITANMPTILEKGKDLIVNVVTGIIGAIPQMASTAGEMISNFGSFLSANLPTIGEKGGEMIQSLVTGIINNLPAIITAAGRLGLTIIQTVIKLTPKMLKAGADLLKGLVKGIGNAAPVRNAMNKIGEALRKPIDTAKDKVKGIMDRIRSFFPLNLGNIFNLRLPHFSISGGTPPFGLMGKGSMPKWSVSWYAKGGIFDAPAVVGVGEAGREAVVPLTGNNMRPFADAIASQMGGTGNTYNITLNVDGAEAPEDYARRFARELQLITRTA